MELAVGYLFAWLVQKFGRVAAPADEAVDRGIDTAMERLHELVRGRLGEDPALERAEEEAEAGQSEPSARTRQRLELAIEDAAEHDADFAEALRDAVAALRAHADGAGAAAPAVAAETAVGGHVDIRADHGSAAAWRMGDVSVGNPPSPGPRQD
ncbi:hypothetical protein ACTWP5_26060 [Streptomyces sp. 4N509B]|uniref:hypothetical protein n=1 Tax=Streptomyces sp. 4N509B TaxID=3457413 RepID=UPI003FD50513